MNEKYTIGDLAKEAGLSTKAIRIYEKKGLINPSAYSESNYRLYDNKAKIILQKIMTLKFIGFSLDEIKEMLEKDKDNDILKSLSYQKQLLELKRSKIDKVIYCVDQAAKRCAGGEIDWNSFTDIMRAVIIDRNADEGYWTALKYGLNNDWYIHIYNNIGICQNETILDIGCGYGNLWRKSWSNIPSHVKVTLMDLHGTWADDFDKFIGDNSYTLKEGTGFEFIWEDVENNNSITGKYDRIIANYLFRFVKEPLKLLFRIKDALSEGGIFYCINGSSTVSDEAIAALLNCFDSSVNTINEKISQINSKHETFKKQLNSVFHNVEWINLESGLAFENTNDFFEYLIKFDFISEYNLDKRKDEFDEYFSRILENKGKIIIPSITRLYNCSN